MRLVLSVILSMMFSLAFAQTNQLEHPRVMELEDKMVKEASSYFARRYPGDPFFIKVTIQPLRRFADRSNTAHESLPYHDTDTEEMVDEWDDPTTSLSALRNRVVKVAVDVSVPTNYDEQRIADIKQEISVYLRLIPFRDDVRVEKKLKVAEKETPHFIYYAVGGVVLASLLFGLMLRWSLGSLKTQNSANSSATAAAPSMASMSAATPSQSNSHTNKTDVQGDVTFHDPIKTLDIVHIKLKQIEESNTFPTLKDVIALDSLCEGNPLNLGALIFEFSPESRKQIFKMGRSTNWLHAFTNAGSINHSCMKTLDEMTRERDYCSNDRDFEDLLIQVWRLGDKTHSFFKSIDQEHAFIILNLIPKSISLQIAKKVFPGAWGKLLENRMSNVVIDPKIARDYLRRALDLEPWFENRILENYKKDKELLSYLDRVNIEDEKDIYETLQKDSFILKVRPAFYKVFELDDSNLQAVIESFPIEKWAMVLMNSSRNYIRIVMDKLDDKKKMVFSTHLKRLDQVGINFNEQNHWKQRIALEAKKYLQENVNNVDVEFKGAAGESERHTA